MATDRPISTDLVRKRARKRRRQKRLLYGLLCVMLLPVLAGSFVRNRQVDKKEIDTHDAEWNSRSFGLAPHPSRSSEAVIQVYAARTRGAKSALAVHTWIATKRTGDSAYKISQIFGWRLRSRGTALNTDYGVPDKAWARNAPMLLLDKRGEGVDSLISKIEVAIANYPYKDEYTVWPGPNSNTFTAWIGLQVPELQLDLPPTAIGKDWRPIDRTFGYSPSGTGVQASFYGLLGVTIAREEGLELNLLGLSYELDFKDRVVLVPGVGPLW